MNIIDLNQRSIERYLGERAREYPFPFQPEYAAVLQRYFGRRVRLVVSDCGGVALPMATSGARWCKLGQLLFPPLQRAERLEPGDEFGFLEQVVRFLAGSGVCDRLTQPPPHCLFSAWPREARACRFGSFVLDLRDRAEDQIIQAMHSSHRYEIRAAERLGVVVREGPSELKAFYSLYQQTMQRSGMGVEPHGYFEDLLAAAPTRWLCAVAYAPDGMPVGSAVIAISPFSAYYLYGGSAEQVKPPGAVKLLHWRIIGRLLSMGVRRYDFVGARLTDVRGTKLDGIQSFKARFGTALTEGGLWKMDVRPLRSHLYDYARSIWRRVRRYRDLPLDIIDQELKKASIDVAIDSTLR